MDRNATPSSARGGAPLLRDPEFTQPYIDVDDWRDAPVRRRYVHGGFEGTELRFAPGVYFPALRVSTARHGDPDCPHARLYNLGRTRVVVG
jgi:hypothetical protein